MAILFVLAFFCQINVPFPDGCTTDRINISAVHLELFPGFPVLIVFTSAICFILIHNRSLFGKCVSFCKCIYTTIQKFEVQKKSKNVLDRPKVTLKTFNML